MLRNLVIAAVVLVVAASAGAQTAALEQVLLPISSPPLEGAFGSIWVTEHFARNNSATQVRIVQDDCGGVSCERVVEPGGVIRLLPALRRTLTWVSVERGRADDLSFSTVVRDESRSVEPWGTGIPTVRERDFRSGSVQLLNVPNEAEFRLFLRIYALVVPGDPNRVDIVVRIFDLDAEIAGTNLGVPLATRNYSLQNTATQVGIDYLQIPDVKGEFSGIGNASRLRVEIARTGGNAAGLWAMMSATNNKTQHVSIITPE